MLDVPCDEPRQAEAAGALRLDQQPQLRGPPGLQGPDASGFAADGRGRGYRRPLRRHPRRQVSGKERAERQATSNDEFEELAVVVLESLPQPFRYLFKEVRCFVTDFAENDVLDELGIESVFVLMGLFT